MSDLSLAHGLTLSDLYDDAALPKVDRAFLSALGAADADVRARLDAARAAPEALDPKAEAELLLALAPHLDAFLAHLFGIEAELGWAAAEHDRLSPLYACKRLFVQRRAAKAYPPDAARTFDGAALEQALVPRLGGPLDQLAFATRVMEWLEDPEANADVLDVAQRYAAWALHAPAGRKRHERDIVFRAPGKVDFAHLVPTETVAVGNVEAACLARDRLEHRDGFALTDPGTDLVGALDEAQYCILCHHQGRDSCSKGLRDKKTGEFAVNALGNTLTGCPLEEKISEAHEAKIAGRVLAALAIVCVDNPMVAATGHRICNDCMKACIYQKQDPVNIPEVETRILKDVLALPWGFEIHGLLTRWNPLNIRRPLPLPDSGYKVLVVGLGPAGFSLAHMLMNEGHAVVAVDGAKIEPLPASVSGVEQSGDRVPFRAIRDVNEIYESLDERVMAGFGGVAEYGITVRWNKNFLKLIRLQIERRTRLTMIGGVRFGGAITAESAFAMGFDHVALCLGAGKPTLLGIPNELARGVRQASDFLMALQLTGAAKMDSVANLQLRMPVVVVGGGLTAIDAATEAMAYYVRQVEKFLRRHETLVAERGEDAVRAGWTEEDAAIAGEFLSHARAVRDERRSAATEGREPRLIDLIDRWGGATVAYRRRLIDSPSYTLNHEEVVKAMEQGVRFAELLAPAEVEVDAFEHVVALKLQRQVIGEDGRPHSTGERVVLPARSVLVAAGTQPNTVLAREWPGFARLDGKYFQATDERGQAATPELSAKPRVPQVLMNTGGEDGRMSFFGDLHPSFAGNVVKAVASAKRGYPVVDRALRARPPSPVDANALARSLNDGLRPVVTSVERLTPTAVEVTARAPLAAAAYRPGQFFRVQNYEANALTENGTTLAMEAVALTGAHVDREAGLISVIALDMGGSTSLVSWLRPGERMVLMGPTGMPSHMQPGETVLLAGGGVGNAELMTMNQALNEAGCRVLYFAGYKRLADRFYVDEMEAITDQIVWCCDEAPGFEPSRPQDKAFVGNIVMAMKAYAEGDLGTGIALSDVDRIAAIGSDRMMAAVAQARHTFLKPHLRADHVAVASINSPMQCMMKEICAQCLQPHRDPETGERSVVFSCFCQDQSMDRVDFDALHQRLRQNAVPEDQTRQWIARCLGRLHGNRTSV
jgi:NADPH-dependent glutamate synthase beta subunit-like oxidoreductase/NAD(P)H-flavin reductase